MNVAAVRPATAADAAPIAAIYNHYIDGDIATFEVAPVSATDMAARIDDCLGPWLVAEVDGEVAGYAYADRFRARAAYRHSVEVTVYLSPRHTGRGLGSALYGALFPLLREAGYHCALAAIALPNPGSVALHEKFGLRPVGTFREVGRKFDRWLDVGYWQVML